MDTGRKHFLGDSGDEKIDSGPSLNEPKGRAKTIRLEK